MGIHQTFEVKREGFGYWVLENGVTVEGPYSHQVAEEACTRLQREASMEERNCMTCGEKFMSEGIHNRMCRNCRSQSNYDGSA